MRKLAKHASDVAVAAGLALFATGLWWIYPPASLLFMGAALVAVGMLMGREPRR